MQRKVSFRYLSVFFLFLMIACETPKPDWPNYILSSLWVAPDARNIKYYELSGTYQVAYNVRECYPAGHFLDSSVKHMQHLKWKRLDYDFRDPRIKTNHSRSPGGEWSNFLDKNDNEIYQWIDDWEDMNKNVVRYGLRFKPQGKSGIDNTCALQVFVIYHPIGEIPQPK